jgi:predicted O-linked N-acetylglucosamine transferase (SPINDLY family)
LKSLQNREYVRQQFARRGVSADRLQLLGPADHYAYLQYYDQIDVALDAFPYNGGTTTMEALWQGVPVLTFSGDRWASRTSASLIRHTHLDRFVAASADRTVQQAIQLATSRRSPAWLAELRRKIEALYRQLDREREGGR